ncbi:MAG: DUF1559 domain-containing protein [Planctomycetaceae bacterium]|nr:DUF1559 domain-containing protein [Planctomycetaceae bacterium]
MMSSQQSRKPAGFVPRLRRGFTLIELMVVISIIAMLVSLMAPAVLQAVARSRQLQCMNNLRQISVAIHSFHCTNRRLPEGNQPNRLWTFQSRLLPFLGRSDLSDRIDFSFPDYCFFYRYKDEEGFEPQSVVLNTFSCPSDPNSGSICETYASTHGRHAVNNYLGIIGSAPEAGDGLLYSGSRICLEDVRDGTTNTLILGERGLPSDLQLGWSICAGGEKPDYSGNQDNVLSTEAPLAEGSDDGTHNNHFWSHHAGSVVFAFADGSVKPLSTTISHPVFQSLSTRSKGDNVSF